MKGASSFFAIASLVLLANLGSADANRLIDAANAWYAEQTGASPQSFQISTPDRRFSKASCEGEFVFSFPFENNLRTIQVHCSTDQWKRFLSVKKQQVILYPVAKQNLTAGTVVTRDAVGLEPRQPENDKEQSPSTSDLIGKRVLTDIREGQPILLSNLEAVLRAYSTNRDYTAGEIVYKADLSEQLIPTDDASKHLLAWPTNIAIAKINIQRGTLINSKDLDIAQKFVVPNRNLAPGEIISSDDVTIEAKATRNISGNPLTMPQQAIGFQTTRTIRSGEPITQADLVVATLVKKGEPVTLTINRGMLTVTVDALALEDGQLGEPVQLQNPDSGVIMTGVVTGRFKAQSISQ